MSAQPFIVRGNQQACAGRPGKVEQQPGDPCGIEVVERRGRLVGDKDGGAQDNRAGDGGALGLALTQLVWSRIGAVGDTEPVNVRSISAGSVRPFWSFCASARLARRLKSETSRRLWNTIPK